MALLDPYTGAWTEAEAAHLMRRAGFGGRPSELTALAAAGMEASVDGLVDFNAVDAPLEALLAGLPNDTTDLGRVKSPATHGHLTGHWMYRMVHGSQPLQEQLTLFLHDTLVSEFDKVRTGVPGDINSGNDGSASGQTCTGGTVAPGSGNTNLRTTELMRDQNYLYRTQGAGPYRDLIRNATRDPAMLLYLDNYQNTRGRAQENYAREVMELFTLGVGNYSEQDVKEVARALTGETLIRTCASNWSMDYTFNPSQHDTASKIVFGQSFNLGAGDTNQVIDLIFARLSGAGITPFHGVYPTLAIFMAWKLLTWFVLESMPMSDPAVGELAAHFAGTSVGGDAFNMREALRKLLKSQLFYDAQHRWGMFKNPADFMASALRGMQLEETSWTSQCLTYLTGMGMRLLEPPNVAGWPQGAFWINSSNIINRFNYGNRLSTTGLMTNAYCDGLKTSGAVAGNTDHAGMIEYFRARLIQEPLSAEDLTALNTFLTGVGGSSDTLYRSKVRGLVHLFMAMPRYQLK